MVKIRNLIHYSYISTFIRQYRHVIIIPCTACELLMQLALATPNHTKDSNNWVYKFTEQLKMHYINVTALHYSHIALHIELCFISWEQFYELFYVNRLKLLGFCAIVDCVTVDLKNLCFNIFSVHNAGCKCNKGAGVWNNCKHIIISVSRLIYSLHPILLFSLRAEIWFTISARPASLANSVIMSILIVHCEEIRREDWPLALTCWC